MITQATATSISEQLSAARLKLAEAIELPSSPTRSETLRELEMQAWAIEKELAGLIAIGQIWKHDYSNRQVEIVALDEYISVYSFDSGVVSKTGRVTFVKIFSLVSEAK